MTADAWLVRHLTEMGLTDPDGVHRAARLRRCEDCGAAVVVGLDGDRAAAVATADTHEIGRAGEFLALSLGLVTYSLRRSYSRKGKRIWNLDPRFSWDMAAARKYPVLAAHRCGMQIPPATDTERAPLDQAPPPAVPPADGSPPF